MRCWQSSEGSFGVRLGEYVSHFIRSRGFDRRLEVRGEGCGSGKCAYRYTDAVVCIGTNWRKFVKQGRNMLSDADFGRCMYWA